VGLLGPPVEALAPPRHQRPHGPGVRAVTPPAVGQLVGPAGGGQPGVQLGEVGIGHGDAVQLDPRHPAPPRSTDPTASSVTARPDCTIIPVSGSTEPGRPSVSALTLRPGSPCGTETVPATRSARSRTSDTSSPTALRTRTASP